MSTQTDAEVRELEQAGWRIARSPDDRAVIARPPYGEGAAVAVWHEDEELALRAALAAAWVLVGNPWGGGTPAPEPNRVAVRTRGTNPLYPGHGEAA